jgi:hypothetical protein
MGLIDDVVKRLRGPSRAEAELAYLNESVSRIDLELREREVTRGRFRHLPRR